LDECYKALSTLHGSQYVKKIDRLLDESVYGFELEPAQNNTSKHQESIMTDADKDCSKQSTDSVDDTYSKCSELCTVQEVNQNGFLSVKERCKFFNHQSAEKNGKDTVKCRNNAAFIRQKPFQDCKRRVVHAALKHRSSPIISNRYAVFEVGVPNKNFHKRNIYPTKSKHSVFELTNIIQNTTVKDKERTSSWCETVYRPMENKDSKQHTPWLPNKLNISTDNNVSKPSGVRDANSTNSSHLYEQNFSRNPTDSGTEMSCAQDTIRQCSIHDKQKVENLKISNDPQSSTAEKQSDSSSVLQDNGCKKQSEQNISICTVLLPLKIKCTTDKAHTANDLHTNKFRTGSESSTYEEKTKVQYTSPNEEEKCLDHVPFCSKQLYEHISSPSRDMLSSMTKEIPHTEEVTGKKSCDSEELQKHEQRIFISSYDLGCSNTTCDPQLPLQGEYVTMGEIYNDCKPISESFMKNCPQFKQVGQSESADMEISGERRPEYGDRLKTDVVWNVKTGIRENAYEECNPYDAHISNSRILHTYKDVPLYQAYSFGTVSLEMFLFSLT
jgi:hypothetical protein